jgi:hypothetical protein
MTPEVLLERTVQIAYGQIYVESGLESGSGNLEACLRGQVNGLCGAAVPGSLILICGTHTGEVGFTVRRWSGEPAVEDGWDDVVEASWKPRSGNVVLAEWDGKWYPLDLPERDYRVRYSCTEDRGLLDFWPAAPASDAILRQTTAHAAYWHNYATALRPFPGPAPSNPA